MLLMKMLRAHHQTKKVIFVVTPISFFYTPNLLKCFYNWKHIIDFN